jgi:hypothetical protein
VLGDLPQDAWHIRGAPRKDVGVGAEKVDEHHFLFRVEGGTDHQRLSLGGSRVEGHLLGLPGSLKAARVLGRGVEVLVDQLLHACDERLVKRQRLSVLHAIDVVVEHMLDRRAHGDDTLWPGIFILRYV